MRTRNSISNCRILLAQGGCAGRRVILIAVRTPRHLTATLAPWITLQLLILREESGRDG
jgi:hypothetical protein